MSAPVLAEPATGTERAPGPARSSRRLGLVSPTTRVRRPRVAYALVAVGGALAIGAAQMGLSILTTQSSYELDALSDQQRDLTYQRQILDDEVAGLSSPQYLAANASALGMVIDQSPSFLRLSDAAVLGAGGPAADGDTVDALNRGAVSNALVSGVPLVTDPKATIEGAPVAVTPVDPQAAPPAVADGLPTPVTH